MASLHVHCGPGYGYGHGHAPGYGRHRYGYGYSHAGMYVVGPRPWWRSWPQTMAYGLGFYGGIVLIMFGCFFCIAGGAFTVINNQPDPFEGDPFFDRHRSSEPMSVGPILLGVGGGMVLLGILLMCVFAGKMKREITQMQQPTAAADTASGAPGAAPQAAPAAASP